MLISRDDDVAGMLLFAWGSDVGWASVVGDDDGEFCAVVVVEGNVQFVGKGINNGSADTKARERTWAGHEGNFGEILKILAVCLELVMNIRK